jgi:hypothetical protein
MSITVRSVVRLQSTRSGELIPTSAVGGRQQWVLSVVQSQQQLLGTVRQHQHRQRQPEGGGDDEPLAAVHLPSRVLAVSVRTGGVGALDCLGVH